MTFESDLLAKMDTLEALVNTLRAVTDSHERELQQLRAENAALRQGQAATTATLASAAAALTPAAPTLADPTPAAPIHPRPASRAPTAVMVSTGSKRPADESRDEPPAKRGKGQATAQPGEKDGNDENSNSNNNKKKTPRARAKKRDDIRKGLDEELHKGAVATQLDAAPAGGLLAPLVPNKDPKKPATRPGFTREKDGSIKHWRDRRCTSEDIAAATGLVGALKAHADKDPVHKLWNRMDTAWRKEFDAILSTHNMPNEGPNEEEMKKARAFYGDTASDWAVAERAALAYPENSLSDPVGTGVEAPAVVAGPEPAVEPASGGQSGA